MPADEGAAKVVAAVAENKEQRKEYVSTATMSSLFDVPVKASARVVIMVQMLRSALQS